jgi:hypothetical protein
MRPGRVVAGALSGLLVVGFLSASHGGSAASLDVDGGTLQVLSLPGWTGEAPGLLVADVDIKPESLEPTSVGDHITAFVTVPLEAFSLDLATLRICVGVAPCGSSGVAATYAGWSQGGALRATFAREGVIAMLVGVPAGEVTLTVSATSGHQVVAGSTSVRLVHAA